MLQELRDIDRLIDAGDLNKAQDACKSLLQQHPTSAVAHERMGDIMYRRELWEDAVEWYDLACQLSDAPELRAKLDDARRRMREARTGPEPVLVDEARPARKIWLALGAAVMLVVVVFVLIGIFGRSRGTEAPPVSVAVEEGSSTPSRTPALTAPTPVRSIRTAVPPQTGTVSSAGPTAHENPERHWAAQQVPRLAPRRPISSRTRQERVTEPITDHDRAVIDAVSSLTWGDNRPMSGRVSAMVDPYTGYAVVRCTVPSSLPKAGLVERVVKQAFRVAMATIQADEVITALTVQMVYTTEQGERVLAFRGNTTRAVLQKVATTTPSFEVLWNQVFRTVWWNPQVEGDFPSGFRSDQASTPTD